MDALGKLLLSEERYVVCWRYFAVDAIVLVVILFFFFSVTKT